MTTSNKQLPEAIAYLNGDFMPLSAAKISPLDRGFLFGDGIYEVIPSYQSRPVGLHLHLARLARGLAAIGIQNPLTPTQWQDLVTQLISQNQHIALAPAGLGIYLHVSRGADSKRGHAFPQQVSPTLFGFAFAIAPAQTGDLASTRGVRVHTETDLRWQRCQIKSTALLGNVLHHQAAVETDCYETILFNANHELTEGSSCNVFVVKDGHIATPALDTQILPGITRHILLRLLRDEGVSVAERVVTRAEVLGADEVWLTSSSKELVPVVMIDGQPVGTGEVGSKWAYAQQLFARERFKHFD